MNKKKLTISSYVRHDIQLYIIMTPFRTHIIIHSTASKLYTPSLVGQLFYGGGWGTYTLIEIISEIKLWKANEEKKYSEPISIWEID